MGRAEPESLREAGSGKRARDEADFWARIGWQAAGGPKDADSLPGDYEENLVERFFGPRGTVPALEDGTAAYAALDERERPDHALCVETLGLETLGLETLGLETLGLPTRDWFPGLGVPRFLEKTTEARGAGASPAAVSSLDPPLDPLCETPPVAPRVRWDQRRWGRRPGRRFGVVGAAAAMAAVVGYTQLETPAEVTATRATADRVPLRAHVPSDSVPIDSAPSDAAAAPAPLDRHATPRVVTAAPPRETKTSPSATPSFSRSDARVSTTSDPIAPVLPPETPRAPDDRGAAPSDGVTPEKTPPPGASAPPVRLASHMPPGRDGHRLPLRVEPEAPWFDEAVTTTPAEVQPAVGPPMGLPPSVTASASTATASSYGPDAATTASWLEASGGAFGGDDFATEAGAFVGASSDRAAGFGPDAGHADIAAAAASMGDRELTLPHSSVHSTGLAADALASDPRSSGTLPSGTLSSGSLLSGSGDDEVAVTTDGMTPTSLGRLDPSRPVGPRWLGMAMASPQDLEAGVPTSFQFVGSIDLTRTHRKLRF
ncbi:MAG: hypothetical protein AAF715_12000 [Myxococcota bacterium]